MKPCTDVQSVDGLEFYVVAGSQVVDEEMATC